jgi:hypothetical protein
MNLSKETQALIDLVTQAKAAEDDVLRSFEGRPDHVLTNDDYARVHRARMRTEMARDAAMVALAKEAGMP